MFDRWLVYYDDVRSPVTHDLIGRLCVVGLNDDRILVKKIKRAKTEGRFDLLSETEPPIEGVQVEWAARVKQLSPQ
ncbi:putative phage repressor [Afipia carboxidovorans OM5]|nr:putative phage repressor [Afipia carboxidovorans OM5]